MARLIAEAPHQVSDVQVTQLAKAGVFTRPADERDLELAAAVIRDMAFPGVVEMFDESLVAAEYYLRPAFPTLRLEYIPQNVSHPGPRVAAETSEQWEKLWGQDLYQRLRRMNEMDIELVRRAKCEILRRLDLIPRVSERLMDLQLRCASLAAASGSCEPGQVPGAVAVAAEGAGVLGIAAGD